MQLSIQCLLILLSPLTTRAIRATESSASSANHFTSRGGNGSRDTLDNTVLGSVVPSSFTIQPSIAGGWLGPTREKAKTQVLLHAVQCFQFLAVHDFNAETVPWAFDHPWFRIDLDGPTLEPTSKLLFKHAVWGLYSAIWYMLSNNFYRQLTFKLLWDGAMVGQIRFIKKDNDNRNIDTDSLTTVLTNTNSTLLGFTASNGTQSSALSTIYHDGRCTNEINVAGQPLPLGDVFMTLFTVFVEIAPKAKDETVRAFTTAAHFNIWLQVDGAATTPRRGSPLLTYEVAIWALGNIPAAMLGEHNNWREMQMTIKIDNTLVGRGRMIAANSSPSLVLPVAYDLNVTSS